MHNVLQLCFAANNILLMRKRNHAFIFLANYRSSVKMEHHFKLGDRMIKQLLNSIITKYRDLLVSRSRIDLLTTDKSRYFAHNLVQ